MDRRDPRIQKTILLLCLMAVAINMGWALALLDSGIGGNKPVISGVLSSLGVVVVLYVLLRDIWKRDA
jgi:hypothetical protein